jgi:hypothetical protein
VRGAPFRAAPGPRPNRDECSVHGADDPALIPVRADGVADSFHQPPPDPLPAGSPQAARVPRVCPARASVGRTSRLRSLKVVARRLAGSARGSSKRRQGVELPPPHRAIEPGSAPDLPVQSAAVIPVPPGRQTAENRRTELHPGRSARYDEFGLGRTTGLGFP